MAKCRTGSGERDRGKKPIKEVWANVKYHGFLMPPSIANLDPNMSMKDL